MHRNAIIATLLGLVVGCGAGGGDDDTAATGAPGTITNPSFVTVGVFLEESDGTYTAEGRELTFEVGVPCFTWDRMSPPHDDYTDSHPHYNASDGNTYVDDTFTWTEFGPEHDLASVEDVCATATGGEEKWANWTDYYEEQHGNFDPYYLKIVDAY